MLLYKSWLETRWRFLIGFLLLLCSAAALVFKRPEVVKLLPLATSIDVSGEIGRRIRESAELAREYRGYVWSQWFQQNLSEMATLFAALLGSGGLLMQSAGGGMLFTLSMPASRSRLLGVRAAVGLAELFALTFLPTLLIPLLSPAIGESYSVGAALIHSLCVFIVSTLFFSLSFLLSTVFHDLWRPFLISLAVAGAIDVCMEFSRQFSDFSLFRVMNGATYYFTGQLPWVGLLISILGSAIMLRYAVLLFERSDF